MSGYPVLGQHLYSSVVIAYLDLMGISIFRRKTILHWSLIRMLCFPRESPFSASSRLPGGPQILQLVRCIQHVELSHSNLPDVRGNPLIVGANLRSHRRQPFWNGLRCKDLSAFSFAQDHSWSTSSASSRAFRWA